MEGMMTSNSELARRRERAVPRGVATQNPAIFIARAQNAELWDVEGKRYIDFAGGIAVLNTGHMHPKITAAVEAQLKGFSHTCFQVTPYESYVSLAERLNDLVPGDFPKKTIFLTTGAEAIENAVKIARAHTGRPAIIAFSGAFHGRTSLGMALTGKVAPYKIGFGPFPGDIYHVPFPDAFHGVSVEQSLKSLEILFKADVDPARVAGILIEPIQGEGGFNVAPFGFLQALRRICDQHGILLIVDEIQTGFGRTGRMFAIEHAGVVPDLVAMAKSLGGGFPLSAVTGRAEIMDGANPGGLGGTYAGSPVACAAGLAVLEVMAEEDLLARSRAIGQLITERLRELSTRNSLDCIGDVRGLGGMVAMELVRSRAGNEPAPELTKAVVQKAADRGLVILSCGVYGNVIRFLVPLTASDDLVREGMDILESALLEANAA
jgi:4-aminobutyrate aminotransferase/(S)-3-amino-2-methylpropionate transaminase